MPEPTNLPRILVLSTAEEPYQEDLNDAFIAGIRELASADMHIEWHNYHDIRLEFKTGEVMAYIQSSGDLISSFSFVYFKSYLRYSEQAAALAACLKAAKVAFVCSELNDYLPMTKLTQFTRLAFAGIPIIPTVYLDADSYVAYYDRLIGQLGSPFIFKSTYGKGGEQNYLIGSLADLERAIQANPNLPFVAQKFIENESDLRVLVVGDKIELIIERRRGGGSHMNNTSQGAAAELMPVQSLKPEYQDMVLSAASALKREIAGIDLMFETGTGQPFVLEVNASPQVASGAFIEEKLAVYSNYLKNVLK